jgi:L-alanine-DL-glutamate epimerase-like enolase superfamily enzyme
VKPEFHHIEEKTMQAIRTHFSAPAPARPAPVARDLRQASPTLTIMEIGGEEAALWDAYARTCRGFEIVGG